MDSLFVFVGTGARTWMFFFFLPPRFPLSTRLFCCFAKKKKLAVFFLSLARSRSLYHVEKKNGVL